MHIMRCVNCGTEISPGSSEQLCPHCLLKQAKDWGGSVERPGTGSVEITTDLSDDNDVREVTLDESCHDVSGCMVIEQAGRYQEISEYARGGMGRILMVKDRCLGRDVALKELLPTLASQEQKPTLAKNDADQPFRRFIREAMITAQLEHPSIVPVYELGRREDGSFYYTMKLVKGKTLSEAIQETNDLDERLRLLPHYIDLCQAIAYAHERGVIHRDLKPSNVMVGQFGETVILDWGVAKIQRMEIENNFSSGSSTNNHNRPQATDKETSCGRIAYSGETGQ